MERDKAEKIADLIQQLVGEMIADAAADSDDSCAGMNLFSVCEKLTVALQGEDL